MNPLKLAVIFSPKIKAHQTYYQAETGSGGGGGCMALLGCFHFWPEAKEGRFILMPRETIQDHLQGRVTLVRLVLIFTCVFII